MMRLGKLLFFFNNCVSYLLYRHNLSVSNKKWGRCIFPLRSEIQTAEANILANGPSLNTELDEALSHSGRINSVCNFAAFYDYFQRVKPSFYFLADPVFFKKMDSDGKIGKLISLLNESVSWDMTIVVPVNGYRKACERLYNKFLTITPVPYVQYDGDEKKRMKLIREGKSAPSFVNVTIFMEYFFLNMGYKKLYLYGVDHTFFDNMFINKNNEVCIDDNHFYGKEPIVIKRYKSDGTRWKLSDWIRDKYLTFLEHERMQEYAEFVGAQIVNCTKNSLIDAYPRLNSMEGKII